MIIVDHLQWKGSRKTKKFCHMFALTEKELHEFAQKIGRKRAWFHRSEQGQIPHYDLDETARAKAIKMGAQIRATKECIRWYRFSKKY